MAENSSQITTSFLLSNLHCPTCVSHIEETLLSLGPRPTSVSPSLVTSWVTVTHSRCLSVLDIQEALEGVGFNVCDITPDPANKYRLGPDEGIGYLDRVLDRLKSDGSKTANPKQASGHIDNCVLCRLEAEGKNDKNLRTPSVVQNGGKKSTSAAAMEEKAIPLVVVDSGEAEDIWRASLAIGGMTCAACSGTITEELEKKDWIKKVVVNLISNSAVVDFIGEEHKNDVVESIEDIGFDAAIDSVVNLKEAQKTSSEGSAVTRTVEILVDGMYCEHCPLRILTALEQFGDRLKVDKALDLQDPIVKLTYTPHAPTFTIRDIITAISAVDQPIDPSIYHPPTLEERSRRMHARERLRILIRVLLTLTIAIPTLIIGIVFMSLVSPHNAGRMFLEHPLSAGISRAQWSLFIMATPVYFLCADVFHMKALKEVRKMWRRGSNTPFLQRFYRFGSMNMLMSLGTSIAYISSVGQLIAAGVHPPTEPDDSSFYFDSVVFLTLFLLIGRLIESYSKSKTGDAVTMLGKLRPTEALLVSTSISGSSQETLVGADIAREPGTELLERINVDLLDFGDVVKVLHGGSPPCDGTVVQGDTKFDESSLTGESRLIRKSTGDEVFAGTVNKDSPVSIKITGVAGASMLDQIVKAVREGQTRRAPAERIADTLTGYFVPFVTLIAIVTWVIWLALGTSGTLPEDYLGRDSGGWVPWSLQFAIAVFVVACPCGLGLAAPTALFVGGGLAAQNGILVKGGGEAFENASKLDCVVFDKTGTLTMGGEPIVTDSEIFSLASGTPEESKHLRKFILCMVNAVEENSSHTIAKALTSFCKGQSKECFGVSHVEEIAGKGMKGTFKFTGSGRELHLIIGNEGLILDASVAVPQHVQSTLDMWKSEGKSVALAAIKLESGQEPEAGDIAPAWPLAAIFAISDPIRPEAPGIIRALQKRGTDVWMLSGDNQITANAIGSQIGIPSSNVIAGVLPSQKAEKIQYLQKSLKSRSSSGSEYSSKRAWVAMVGDGINDSPALTTADVGIAVGSGSDIAISSAEFVLVSSNLNSLITLLDLSKFVFRRIKFNFGWALVYNMVALPVAAGALYPIVSNGRHIRLDPVWASLAMAASSISVVMSSLALRSRLPWVGFKVKDNVGGE